MSIPKLRVPLTVEGGGPNRLNLATNPLVVGSPNFTAAGRATITNPLASVEGLPTPPTKGERVNKHTFAGESVDTNAGNRLITLPAADTYTASWYVLFPASWDGGNLNPGAELYTGSTEDFETLALATHKGRWQRMRLTFTLAEGDLVGGLTQRVSAFPSSERYFYTVGLLIEPGPNLGNFFPRADQLAAGEAFFTGAENASPTELKPAPAHLATVEQDSLDEIAQCVEAALNTIVGSRIDDPDYGIPDETFKQLSPDEDAATLIAAVEGMEPRARLLSDTELEEAIKRVRIEVRA